MVAGDRTTNVHPEPKEGISHPNLQVCSEGGEHFNAVFQADNADGRKERRDRSPIAMWVGWSPNSAEMFWQIRTVKPTPVAGGSSPDIHSRTDAYADKEISSLGPRHTFLSVT